MPSHLSDAEIAALLAEPKPLPPDYRQRLIVRSKRGHKERELLLTGENGGEFSIILRQSDFNALDFSVILAYHFPKTTQIFRLRRYNGRSHEHTNTLEQSTFYQFHIHQATARYQDSGLREDAFAQPTERYTDFNGALRCLLEDGNFLLPSNMQLNMFGEES